MNQRQPSFHTFSAQNYAYAHHPYAPQQTQQQQQQQQTQFNSNVQYPVPPQHASSTYYPSLPPNPSIGPQSTQSLQQARRTATTPRRQNAAGPTTPPVSGVNGTTTRSAGHVSPGMPQYDGDVSMSFQDDNDENFEPDSGPVFQLPPPPENTYASDKELEKAMHAWSLEHGYELVRRASKKNARGVLYKRYYHCSKHGRIANTGKLTDETRVRVNRKSNRIGCPMSLAVVAVDPSNPTGQWQIRHRKIHHNHGPMEAVALAGHRRRARMGGVEKAVDGLFTIGTPTAQVLTFLQRTNPNGLFTRTDVANMKLKFKKYGSCIDRRDADASTDAPRATAACSGCREKKVKCDAQRPQCTTCIQTGRDCQYIPDADATEMPPPTRPEPQASSAAAQLMQTPRQVPGPRPRSAQPSVVQPPERVQEILADINSFKATHIAPTKLNLQSSSVEILAATACGNGDSYKAVPTLEHADQWSAFQDAMTDASRKENTFEVLLGRKTEPTRPVDDTNIGEWNEYIQQLAIFNRRNTALLGALLPKLSVQYRPRLQHLQKAAEVWQMLEGLCQPRGSDRAYKLYLELHAVTLQSSRGLADYIARLEAAYTALNRASVGTDGANSQNAQQWSAGGNAPTTSRPQKPNSGISEDMLCFLFLRNLGPAYSRWSENMCRTSNVGGFGTGRRVGYADLTRSVLEWEGMQGQAGASL